MSMNDMDFGDGWIYAYAVDGTLDNTKVGDTVYLSSWAGLEKYLESRYVIGFEGKEVVTQVPNFVKLFDTSDNDRLVSRTWFVSK